MVDKSTKAEKDTEIEKFKTMVFLLQSDQRLLDDLIKRLEQLYDGGYNEYLGTIAGAYDLMVKECGTITMITRRTRRD